MKKIISTFLTLSAVVAIILAVCFVSGAECTSHTDSGNDGLCDSCSVPLDGLTAMAGHTVDLARSITVNFYFKLDEKVNKSNDAYFTSSINGRSETLMVADAEIVGECYVLPVRVAAKELSSVITAKLVYGDSVTTEYTYTAKEYCEAILAKPTEPTYAPYVDLVKALLNYGGYAQKYFNFNTGALANAGLYTEAADPVAAYRRCVAEFVG